MEEGSSTCLFDDLIYMCMRAFGMIYAQLSKMGYGVMDRSALMKACRIGFVSIWRLCVIGACMLIQLGLVYGVMTHDVLMRRSTSIAKSR